jgi:alpha-L-fucosidase
MTRRNSLRWLAAGAGAATQLKSAFAAGGEADRAARMQWWHAARFGMFVHWGVYSTLGRAEWVMEDEGIPVAEYEQFAKQVTPKPNAARDWCRRARQAGHAAQGPDSGTVGVRAAQVGITLMSATSG